MSEQPNGSTTDEAAAGTDEVWRPGFVFYSVSIFAGLVILAVEGSANPGLMLAAAFLGLPLWLGLPIAWVFLFARDAYRSRLRMGRRAWARWLGLPAMAVLCLALAFAAVPFRLRFELSRSAFDQAAARVLAGGSVAPSQIGLFYVDHVTLLDNGVLFEDRTMGFIDPCGLAYASVGRPQGVYVDLDLGQGWWFACYPF